MAKVNKKKAIRKKFSKTCGFMKNERHFLHHELPFRITFQLFKIFKMGRINAN